MSVTARRRVRALAWNPCDCPLCRRVEGTTLSWVCPYCGEARTTYQANLPDASICEDWCRGCDHEVEVICDSANRAPEPPATPPAATQADPPSPVPAA